MKKTQKYGKIKRDTLEFHYATIINPHRLNFQKFN